MKPENTSREDLSQRVRRTLEDLAAIQRSLVSHAEEFETVTETGPLLDLELAAELKSVVDALRKLLWAYIQALSAKSGRKPQEILEWYKMELAVDMLRSARKRPASRPEERADFYTFQDLVTNSLAISSLHTDNERTC